MCAALTVELVDTGQLLLFLLVGSKNVYAALTVEFLDPGQLLLPFFLVDPISFKKWSSWSQATTRTGGISDGKGSD